MRAATFLYTNIGRGHPFYLDGIVDELSRREPGLDLETPDVFQDSSVLARAIWQQVRWLYRRSGSPGPLASVYARLRSGADVNRDSALLRVLRHPLRRRFGSDAEAAQPLVVAHPLLVALLRERPRLYYQHGEVVAPAESLVRGAASVLVPTREVARAFLDLGYPTAKVVVTGLCIEPPLARTAASAAESRMLRLQRDPVPTGAFFSSGAEPDLHVERLVAAAVSARRSDGRVVVVARRGGKLERRARAEFRSAGMELAELPTGREGLAELPPASIAVFGTRADEVGRSESVFEHLDYFASPTHERSNWPLGLGLPMFAVGPTIGPFSPLNRQLLLDAEVAQPIEDLAAANDFGTILTTARREGRLERMAENGWGKLRVDGFATAADFVLEAAHAAGVTR